MIVSGVNLNVLSSLAIISLKKGELRNEFDFLNVHGMMNTSGLLQSK